MTSPVTHTQNFSPTIHCYSPQAKQTPLWSKYYSGKLIAWFNQWRMSVDSAKTSAITFSNLNPSRTLPNLKPRTER